MTSHPSNLTYSWLLSSSLTNTIFLQHLPISHPSNLTYSWHHLPPTFTDIPSLQPDHRPYPPALRRYSVTSITIFPLNHTNILSLWTYCYFLLSQLTIPSPCNLYPYATCPPFSHWLPPTTLLSLPLTSVNPYPSNFTDILFLHSYWHLLYPMLRTC